MSRGVNLVVALGNMGADPDVKYSASGVAVANFSIAVSESWKDKQTGEAKEKTTWINCVCFARLAEVVSEYCRKGSKVYIEGKLQTDTYEKDGVKQYSTKVNVRELQMLDSKPSTKQQPADDFDQDAPPF